MTDIVATNLPSMQDLQQSHTTRYAKIAENSAIGSIASIAVGACGVGALVLDGLAIWSTAVGGVGIAACIIFGMIASHASRRRDEQVYIPGSTPIDVAIRKVSAFLALYKDPKRTAQDMERSANRMIECLQEISSEPLVGIRRSGYHPDGDTYENEGLDFQWDLVHSAMRDLWPMYEGKEIFTRNQVQSRVRLMIPPLRTILRRSGTFVQGIEYGDYDPASVTPPTRKELKAVNQIGRTPVAVEPQPTAPTAANPIAAAPVDLFTPIEPTINAAATMHVATLRTQIATFRGADPSLFAGTDRQSGDLLADVHLPNLIQAYRTAHDASQGEERDDVRAQFARTLRMVRDSFDQIMSRHAAEARAALDVEMRFLESRSETSTLDR